MKQRLCAWGQAALALPLSLALTATAWAGATDAERIAELERKLEALTQRLLQVEGGNAVTPALPDRPPAAAAPEPSSAPPPPPLARPAESGIPIRAFVDVGFASDTPDPTGRKGGFTVGNVNLYMTPSFGEHIKSIVELVFEQDEHGGLVVDLERVQLGYTASDALTLWAGRYHTPFGHWNAAFHHGAQIQTSVSRPRFLGFEDQGGILPVHAVGLLGSGGAATFGGRSKYDVYVANGTPIVDGDLTISGFKDDDRPKMLGANLRHEFDGGLKGLTLGLHALTSQVGAYDATGALTGRTRFNAGGAFAVFDDRGWEWLAEYYVFRNQDLTGATGTHASWAGYAQLGHSFDTLTPYVRFEKAALDQDDPYFANLRSGRSYRRQSVGLRYDLNPTTALKLEFGRTTEEQAGAGLTTHSVRGQVAVRF